MADHTTLNERLRKAYQGKRVWLTGHTGFKGSWLLAVLHHLGAEVYGFALPPDETQPLFHLLDGPSLCAHREGEIRDAAALDASLTEARPDYVFHLAAQSLVRRSYRQPVDTWDVNVLGTVQVLEAVRRAGRPCNVVVVTTDKVYENAETGNPLRETDPLGGWDPYSASKAAAELVVSSYRCSFFHPGEFPRHKVALASARAGNVIGGGDANTDRLLPDTIRALRAGQPIPVRNPTSVRPWQHVLESLSGYLLLGAALADDPATHSIAYNFGPEPSDCLTVADVVEQAIDAWGSGDMQVSPDAYAVHEAGLLRLDSRMAMYGLDWKPRLTAAEAIRWTVDWHRQPDPKAATFAQIEAYLTS